MNRAPQIALVLGVIFALSFPSLEASKLKDCGKFGCYKEPEPDAARFGLSDIWETLDQLFVRDSNWDETTMEEMRNNVTFHLYYSSTQKEDAMIGDKKLFNNYSKKKLTKIIIHGWYNNHESEIGQGIKDAYLASSESSNVIVVDWSDGSSRLYNRAKACVPLVAQIVAEFIDRLVKEHNLYLTDLHIIGHSLGAHIAGLTGVRIKKGKPDRVTGLDPAKPTFDNDYTERISKKSARYVDIIHSCSNRLGLIEPLGHVDYYPNRGEALQRGCKNDYDGACSHARSYEIYAESINNPKGFAGTLCSDWIAFRDGQCNDNPILFINETTPTGYTEGSYYLKTAGSVPLAAGKLSRILTEDEIKEDEEDSSLAKLLFSIL